MKKKLVSVELADGTVHDDARLVYADQVALERTARAQGWELAKQTNQATALLAWHALRREGRIAAELTFDDFEAQLVDYDVREEDTAAGGAVDPTQPGA